MTYEKFSMRVRGGCVMTASEHARHEERAEGVRTEPPVAGVGQLHFRIDRGQADNHSTGYVDL